MQSLRRPIKSVTWNFNEQDVIDSTSLDQLRDWWDKVQMDIASMENKIVASKEDGFVNQNWFKRIKGALFLQQELAKRIQNKVIELKNNPPEYCYLEMKFIEVAERELDKKMFKKLLKLTKKEIVQKK
jgi:hypothetical protein